MIEYAYLETTNYCNLRCSFCNREEVINDLRHITIEEWRTVLDSIAHHPIREAKLMGMGEPFLHPQFDIIVGMFKEYFPDAHLISATNCQYDITRMPWFERALAHIDYLYLSIDGYGENYERDRPPSKWSKLIQFLDQLQTVDRQGCDITINYVVNPDNVYDIQRVHDEILVPYDLRELRLNIAQNWSESAIIGHGYSEEQLEYLRGWQPYIKGRGDWDYSDCFWVKNGLYTTVDGNVLACCMNTSAKPYGNIYEQRVEDIHSSEAFSKLRNGCANNDPERHCMNCSYKELAPLLKELGV